MRQHLRFARALLAMNLKACMALRGAFWLQAGAMLANNVLFFTVWWIFFDRFDEIGGWKVGDMLALFGIVASGFGLAIILAGGVRDLAGAIANGDLDPLMSQPKNLLLHAVGSRSYASGWGDLSSGLLFAGISGVVSPGEVPLLLLGISISACVFIASGILLHSLAFWLGQMESLARMMWEFLVAFSMYPEPIFTGALRVVLYSLVPAGFIGFLPVSLVRDFSWYGLGAALLGAAGYLGLAVWVFGRGLRRYESGNRFGVRA